MRRSVAFLLVLLTVVAVCRAQEPEDSSRWDFHAAVGGTVMSGFGHTQALTWAAPSVSYRASERLKLHGGFVAAGTLLPNNFALQGRGEQSLAPRREGTRALALWAAGDYRVSDNLRLWAAVAVARGWMKPLWAAESMPLKAAAFDGGFAYRFDGGSVMAMHFSFVYDQYGSLLGQPYYPYGPWPAYGDPFGYAGPMYTSWGIYGGRWPFWN